MNYLVEKTETKETQLVELDFLTSENQVSKPLEDLIKFDSLEIEKRNCVETNGQYNKIISHEYSSQNVLEEYLKCYEESLNNIMDNDNPIYKYLENENENEGCIEYDYWRTNSILREESIDEILSFYDQRKLILPYNYYDDSGFLNPIIFYILFYDYYFLNPIIFYILFYDYYFLNPIIF